MHIQENVPLGPHTSLGVGGPARFFVKARDESTLLEAREWARRRGVAIKLLGGGSNVLVADQGVDALVIRVGLRGVAVENGSSEVLVTAAAGEPWDDLVRLAVERSWAGIECLSGIPGFVGATPIQNVGAYGQEVSRVIRSVRVLDLNPGAIETLSPADCRFAYRDSYFKSGEPGRFAVLGVSYALEPGGAPTVRYADIEAHLEREGIESPTLAEVRETVLAVRRTKSMVIEPDDENHRSCGSFFLNPIVDEATADALAERTKEAAPPRHPGPGGRVKLSAAWLIERAGYRRGERRGTVGLSSRHTLAIVCHQGATARAVFDLAREIRTRVFDRFGVLLSPEPALWGFDEDLA